MRYALMNTLHGIAAHDDRIMVLTADLGYTVFEGFAEAYPGRFVNVGVAEANMIGVAAGLATTGKVPFTYSIATFATMRSYEQIRNDVCAQNLNVKLIGVGAGFSYGSNGLTHHALEDMAITRVLPNLCVICPADPVEAGLATAAAVEHDGPVYLRLGRAGETRLHQTSPEFRIGRGIRLREGSDCTLIATGSILREALGAADLLADGGIHAEVISMPVVKPLDEEIIVDAARRNHCIVTVEEHSIIGGLGSAVAECLMDSWLPNVRLTRLGVPGIFCSVVGDQDYLRDYFGLSALKIMASVRRSLESAPRS